LSLFYGLALVADPVAGTMLANTVISHPEAALYDAARDAHADVDAALARAKISGKGVILVMGANWCHDSKSLAGRFELPRFKALMAARYEVVYIDVAHPQSGHGRNIDIAQRFGIKKIKGTPTVLILSSEGKLLNKKDAPKWSNAASRSEADIYTYFVAFGR
jgi:thiol-disulfide isomerase/thioredoxin